MTKNRNLRNNRVLNPTKKKAITTMKKTATQNTFGFRKRKDAGK